MAYWSENFYRVYIAGCGSIEKASLREHRAVYFFEIFFVIRDPWHKYSTC